MNRNIDNLGRIVIPKEMRNQLKIKEGDPLHIELVDNKIIITNSEEVDYKLKIDKAIEYIENLVFWYEHNNDVCSLEDKFVNELLDILKGKGGEIEK